MNAIQEKMIENFRDRMKLVRQACGWDQQELGTFIGVSRQSINNIENKRNALSATQYLAICVVIDFYHKDNPKLIELVGAILAMSDAELGPKAVVNGSLTLGWLTTVELKNKKKNLGGINHGI